MIGAGWNRSVLVWIDDPSVEEQPLWKDIPWYVSFSIVIAMVR